MDLVRSEKAIVHLTTFVVAGVSTILITRAYLALTGYPQIGGDTGLHVAHVLPGGLLMMLALVLGFAYIGRGPRPVAALLGGVGFGLFIDEVGKFVTADNDYFFEPAAAIMYAVFAGLVVAAHTWRRHRPLSDQEKVANAAHVLVDGLAGRLPDSRRREVVATLDALGHVRGAPELRELLTMVEPRPPTLPQRFERLWGTVAEAFDRVAQSRFAAPLLAVLFAFQAIGAALVAVGLWQTGDSYAVTICGVLIGTSASLVFAALGVRMWRMNSKRCALDWFQRSALTSLLLTQVFLFAASQFAAVIGLLVDLLLLGVVATSRARVLPRHDRGSTLGDDHEKAQLSTF
ncbi:hypothetical protein LWF15_24225 [Kineosporia rhizophila]|uniref:hypothetical protein n=1 Tax=Kineosporia rhizophila TaxID=84633 RepID=UPI001E5664A4|nr:hypothetical protein [Kineosporia rhizophila]MCE0538611.1 hypothetical protein [Kineosporia rhizophila]